MSFPFRDKRLPLEQRVDDLLSRLTRPEKLDYLNYETAGIPRLGIPPYSWWSEALHGLARSGAATVFPQAIALAATFTPEIVERMGRIIAEEGRASFNSVVSEKDLHETYLPAFKACVKAGAMAIMPAYTACNGVPCTMNRRLLVDILREQWHFTGVVLSDCGAGTRLVTGHRRFEHYADALKAAFENGLDIALDALDEPLRQEMHRLRPAPRLLDEKLRRQFRILFRLGILDDEPDDVPSPDVIEAPRSRREALNASRRGIVLLKNRGSLLPLDKRRIRTLAVIGPNADNAHALMGNYYGRATHVVTLLQGILNEAEHDVRVIYARGSDLVPMMTENIPTVAEAVSAAERADVTVLCIGLSPELEDEESTGLLSKNGADKTDLELPENQLELVKAVSAVAKKLVLVNLSGSAVRIPDEKAGAVLQVFYPGAEGGTAVADVLFGKVNPSGHLPVTFYRDISDLPDFCEYGMAGRTYRYFSGKTQYPFGYGLSYTKFQCTRLRGPKIWRQNRRNTLRVTWKNCGDRSGEDVIQVYVQALDASVSAPIRQLVAVRRISLRPGEEREYVLHLPAEAFGLFDENANLFFEKGSWNILVDTKRLRISF